MSLGKPSLSESFKEWQKSSRQLEEAAMALLDKSCSELERSGIDYINLRKLVLRMDKRLDSFESRVKYRIIQAKSSVALMENRLMCPIHRLPADILTQIFRFVVHDSDPQVADLNCLSPTYRAKSIYRKLYRLLRVCTLWKRILFSGSTFWSLIPIVHQDYRRNTLEGAKFNLEMAAGSNLHLVAELVTAGACDFVLDTLACHGFHVKSANFISHLAEPLETVLQAVAKAENNLSGCLTSLSLYFNHTYKEAISFQARPWRKDLNRVLGPLQVLRLRNVHIQLRGLQLRDLTELRLQDIRLDTMMDLEEILWNIWFTPQLQILELISIRACRYPPNTTSPFFKHLFPFPSLKELYLSDLTHNVLEVILGAIAPGAHHTTLNLTRACLEEVTLPHQTVLVDPGRLKDSKFRADALTTGSDYEPQMLASFLRLAPTATELLLEQQYLDVRILKPFVHPESPGTTQDNGTFPRFTKIHIARSSLGDVTALGALQDVVSSHPVVELGLGIGTDSIWRSCFDDFQYADTHKREELGPYREWFLKAVPKVVWLPVPHGDPRFFGPTECARDVWQL